MSARQEQIRTLYAARPRRAFVRASVALLLAVVAASWTFGGFSTGDMLTSRRLANAERFLGELRPWSLQQDGAPQGTLPRLAETGRWFAGMWREKGAEAVATTLAISIVAVLLAGLGGALFSLPAARNIASARPFLGGGRAPPRSVVLGWQAVVLLTRAGLTLLRSLPEYVWAFLLLALLGPSAWPMILALALHNTGIVGKLTAEVVENVDVRAPSALRGLGASRPALVLAALMPLTLPRFLLFFFYRWETCVREATVLGMLGMASLGFWIVDARARNTYDEMGFFILCGALLVLLGDVVSAVVRHVLRRA